MKNNDEIRFTMRLSESINKRVEKESAQIGISKNAFILYAINKVLKEDSTEKAIGNT